MERKIGALGKLIRSASKPHARIVANLSRHSKADLVSSFGEQFLRLEWAAPTGKRVAAPGLPAGSLTVPESVGPVCVLLSPRSKPACLSGAELTSMGEVFRQENATEIPLEIKERKYLRAKLTTGQIACSEPLVSDSDKDRRRTYIVPGVVTDISPRNISRHYIHNNPEYRSRRRIWI